jgi:endonuclease/exonuclease/phosphatase family metal-dependent hydrolase
VPAFAHLDHVLISPELAVGAVRDHAVVGSDHRAVVAELALR